MSDLSDYIRYNTLHKQAQSRKNSELMREKELKINILEIENERLRKACETVLRHIASHQVYDKDSARTLRNALEGVE